MIIIAGRIYPIITATALLTNQCTLSPPLNDTRRRHVHQRHFLPTRRVRTKNAAIALVLGL